MRTRLARLVLCASLFAASAAPATSAPGRLVVRSTVDRSGGLPIEGSYTYLTLRDARGRLLFTKRARRLNRSLGPGRYRLSSYQRTCDGNCDNLDEPSVRCARAIRIRPGRVLRLRLVINFTRGCAFTRAAK